jgi:hypothetical protein
MLSQEVKYPVPIRWNPHAVPSGSPGFIISGGSCPLENHEPGKAVFLTRKQASDVASVGKEDKKKNGQGKIEAAQRNTAETGGS